jgi:putative transcriptional regulator
MYMRKPSIKDEHDFPNYSYQHAPAWFRSFVLGRLVISLSLNQPDETRTRRAGATLYNNLAMLRMEHRMSRHDLARALDISDHTVTALERDEYNPSLALALRISQLFALPIEAIFFPSPEIIR